MFKIHDDKVYFVAETPDINKVIEIFLPKDDRGTIMDSHEIRVDLCRAVIHMEKKGVRVLKVRNIEDTNKASIDIRHMPEYQEAAESPVSDVVNACIESCFDSGAMFNLPCKANRKTHEVFAVECCASPDDDDSFSYAEVKINGKDSARPSLVLLHFVRKQFVQTASPCRFRQAACTTAYRTKTCRTAITLRSNSATCLRRSKSFCRLLKTTRHRWLRSTGMCP